MAAGIVGSAGSASAAPHSTFRSDGPIVSHGWCSSDRDELTLIASNARWDKIKLVTKLETTRERSHDHWIVRLVRTDPFHRTLFSDRRVSGSSDFSSWGPRREFRETTYTRDLHGTDRFEAQAYDRDNGNRCFAKISVHSA